MFKLSVTQNGFVHACGHRGHSIGSPENTIAALQATLEHGGTSAEIDMVQNVGALKSGHATLVAADIEAVVRAVPGIPVKVILETAALTQDEKLQACRLAMGAGAAFVKTSTGFHPAGGGTVSRSTMVDPRTSK